MNIKTTKLDFKIRDGRRKIFFFIFSVLMLSPVLCLAQFFTPPKPGDMAPDFTLPTTDGKRVGLSDSWKVEKNKVTIVSFYEYTCKPCIPDLQFLQKLRTKFDNPGIKVLVVSVGSGCEKAKQILKKSNISLPLLCDNYKVVTKRYRKKPFYPENFLIDRNGIFRKKITGYNNETKQNLEKKVREMLGKR